MVSGSSTNYLYFINVTSVSVEMCNPFSTQNLSFPYGSFKLLVDKQFERDFVSKSEVAEFLIQ